MDSKSSPSRNNIILFALLAFVAVSIFVYKSLGKNLNTADTSVADESPNKNTNQVISAQYTDGTYTATGGYISPGGPEEVEVTLILRGDIIEDSTFVVKSELPTSIYFQEKFAQGYKEFVVGKNINEVKLDKIAGSSLTPLGFNEALENIKAQAKS